VTTRDPEHPPGTTRSEAPLLSSHQGRPGLRLAARRAVWGAQRANPVYAARYRHLTTRENNKLRPTQAQTVIAAAILRHLHAVISTGQTRDPAIATHGTRWMPPAAA
jgi:transposase